MDHHRYVARCGRVEGNNAEAERLLARWWEKRIARQKEIGASIAAKADVEFLYDKPYVDNARVRVAGPFTVETLSPHRVLAVDHDDELIDVADAAKGKRPAPERKPDEASFAEVISKTSRRRACSRRTRKTGSSLPRLPAGRASSSAPKAGSWRVAKRREAPKARQGTQESGGPASSSAPPRVRDRRQAGPGQRRRCLPSANGRDHLLWAGGDRLLVHRHGLQRGKLLRPPRLLPRRQRPLQGAEDDTEGRDRRGRLGEPQQRNLPPVREALHWPHRRQGHQSLGRRGDEGVRGGVSRVAFDRRLVDLHIGLSTGHSGGDGGDGGSRARVDPR